MGIFLGYAMSSKGYIVYNFQSKKIVTSRDIHVDEDAYWDWENDWIQRSVKLAHPVINPNAVDAQNEAASEEEESDSQVLKTKSLVELYKKCKFVVSEPSGFEEASLMTEWNDAMKEELAMINKNNTISRPKDRKVIGVKWVYRTKLNLDGSIRKHKARLVVKRYS